MVYTDFEEERRAELAKDVPAEPGSAPGLIDFKGERIPAYVDYGVCNGKYFSVDDDYLFLPYLAKSYGGYENMLASIGNIDDMVHSLIIEEAPHSITDFLVKYMGATMYPCN